MKKALRFAKPTSKDGIVNYSDTENEIWSDLIKLQKSIIQNIACEEYIRGLELLNLPENRIPQCYEVSSVLKQLTGWELEPVAGLIPTNHFFSLLANRKFPAATFIRRRNDLHYSKDPDIFHEIFGHCPLLTNQFYADSMQMLAKFALSLPNRYREKIARLYWFTFEVGLIKTNEGLRAYGGGILSSNHESDYCLTSQAAARKPFNMLEVMQTPYQADIIQPVYYVLDNLNLLYELFRLTT